jgi:hypothetical protein
LFVRASGIDSATSSRMKLKSLCLPACGALVAACLFAPNHSRGQAGSDEVAIAALIEELAVQQVLLTENQTKIDAKLATIAEDVRLARIYVARGGGKASGQ